MATRKGKKANLSTVSSSSAPAPLPEEAKNILTLSSIESTYKQDISLVYIPELHGSIYRRPVGANIAIEFMRESATRDEQIKAMCQYVADSLCHEDGTPFISVDQVTKWPLETIDSVVTALSLASSRRKEGNA